MTERLDVADWAFPVEGLGPGKRLILWVRGCPLACQGCMTPELWQNGKPEQHRSVRELADILAPLVNGLDGLTISGGEPTLQSLALASLIRLLRQQQGLAELEVLSYSGYSWEELMERGAEVAEYLSELDILIDGRYEQNSSNHKQWRGSDNQRVFLLSQRSLKYENEAENEMPESRPLQLQMLGANRYRIIGLPKRGDFASYRQTMEQLGISVGPEVGPGRNVTMRGQ